MSNSIRSILVCIFIMFQVLVTGQTTCSNKSVKLSSGQITLKTAFKIMSDQTGCIFSYDPTKILDNQLITIPSSSTLKFRIALQEILPKQIQFKLKGKYVILQKSVLPTVKVFEPKVKAKQSKEENRLEKSGSIIGKDLNQVRLVIPAFENTPEDTRIKQTLDTIHSTVTVPLNTKPIEDTINPVIADTVIRHQAIVEIKQTIVLPSSPIIKPDTITVVKPGFVDFIKKRVVFDTELAVNSRLTAVSIHLGVYGIYAILSVGNDFNNSNSLGTGMGTNIKINDRFGVNIDLIRHSLFSGASYKLGVRTKLTQLSPELHYSVGSVFKFFGGPVVQVIKSSLENAVSTTDLGRSVGYGIMLGVRVDLKNLLLK